MSTAICIEEQFEIPFVQSLAEFRAWATSDECPEKIRVDYIAGRIEVEMSPEDLFTHGSLKGKLVLVLGQMIEEGDLGEFFTSETRVSCPRADLSAEPDFVFVSHESFETVRVRAVPKSSGKPDRYVELEGAPDLVVEVVSDSSMAKDTLRLPEAYWRAGIPEFWLADARGQDLFFRIHRRGADRYEAAPVNADGFQRSAVFGVWFRLTRRRHRGGRWRYDLERRSE
jgi:Uma2 family endonuclease